MSAGATAEGVGAWGGKRERGEEGGRDRTGTEGRTSTACLRGDWFLALLAVLLLELLASW